LPQKHGAHDLHPDIYMQNLLGYGGTRAIDDGVIQHYVGDARISWADCDDVAEVARICIVNWCIHGRQRTETRGPV
jgi:NAD(P)H dehydrogenase (quinone)